MKRWIVYFLLAVAGGVAALGLNRIFEPKQSLRGYESPIPIRSVNYIPGSAMSEPDFEGAAAISVHAVVHIRTEFERKSDVYDNFFNFFNWGPPMQSQRIEGMGSGVIIASDGYIVTNNHVVQDADNITVTLNDKRVYKGTVVGTDPGSDLAVIKIDEKNLPYLIYGNSDDVRIGQWVLAVGNPFNLTSTVTAGIVSAKARDINILGEKSSVESFIQTDAAVNPGNSGGALVDIRGQLIGINAAIASGTGSYVGYSFAIPANIVKKVVDDIMKYGKTKRAFLGVYYREIDDQFAKDNGFHDIRGVYLNDIVKGGAADKAGVRKGDVLISVDNFTVNSKSEMSEVIAQHSPGDKINLTVVRDGKELSLPVTLLSETENNVLAQNDKISALGATFQKIGDAEKEKFNIDDGYKIISLQAGPLKNSGIREGFIVVAVDKQQIKSADDLRQALTSKKGGVLIQGVYPNGMVAYYGIGL
ncbi:MAG: Do family serine endopeptidase [Syntrophothermus sp.]